MNFNNSWSDGGGTYSTKQGFPAELPPSATLLRMASTVGVEFKLEQVICDTFDSYVLFNPFPIIYVCLVLIVGALVPARRAGHIMVYSEPRTDSHIPWIHRQLPRPMTIRDLCLVAVYSQHEVADEPLLTRRRVRDF